MQAELDCCEVGLFVAAEIDLFFVSTETVV